MVVIAEAALSAMKGAFSMTALMRRPLSLSSGKRSIIRRTAGMVTAMGLLISARANNTRAEIYQTPLWVAAYLR